VIAPDFSAASKLSYGSDAYGIIADFIASKFPGSNVVRSKSTSSAYVYIPGAKVQVRVSGHQKYGVTLPSYCHPTTRKGLPALIDRAVRAAFTDARRYQDIKPWGDL